MAQGKRSQGKCAFCGREMTKGGLARHLSVCSERHGAINATSHKAVGEQRLYHLQVQDAWQPDYWLHLEMNGTAALGKLDHYLRAIWLECCDHLSQFSLRGWRGEEIPKGRRAERVFEPGMELTHIYDFGTSSETLIKVVGVRKGKPLSAHPIVLMARNNPPEARCTECGQPASWLCVECLHEFGEAGTLCDQHAQIHPHTDYGEPISLVNSPRLGMCGYTGPAEPPY